MRGTSEQGLASNQTYAEGSGDQQYGYVSGFGSDGFTLTTGTGGNISLVNNNTTTYVAWNWLGDGVAGGTLNENGTLDSQVNVNTAAGFSIVEFTGNATANQTVGHGLSQAPELLIFKRTGGVDDWRVGSDVMGWTGGEYLALSTSAAESTNTSYWDTAPTATVFETSDSSSTNATDGMIVYCFHSVEGYSKVGGYEGNGNADGTFIYTGFRPAFVMIKNWEATGDRWLILNDKMDTYNVATNTLAPNLNQVVSTGYDLDFVSNGIKIRDDESPLNTSGIGYLYLAFAEFPFKYANAR